MAQKYKKYAQRCEKTPIFKGTFLVPTKSFHLKKRYLIQNPTVHNLPLRRNFEDYA